MSQPLASIDRPLGLRLRADLLATAVESPDFTTWVVYDPLTLEHFQFSAEEYALMDWIREPITIAELRRRFNRKFSPQIITPQIIWDFLSRLHTSGLLVSDSAGQGPELLLRRDRERLRQWAFSWTSILGIRFRGFDPDRFLTACHDECRWLFSPVTLFGAVALVLYGLSLFVGHFGDFRSRLPELSALVDPRNLPWLLLAIGGVKVLHEFGHAMTSKHFGGEVHEMGFMLLVFSPCLYCDVSDAWRMPSKWRRIAVSAAGILVELVLASLATIVWWYAQPGVVRLVALNIMIVCTFNTLLINGNPLMRYDGYYILSDLVDTPNLWQRSREVLQRLTCDWLLASGDGDAQPDDPLIPARKRPWLAAYAVCSKAYMIVICVAIVWRLIQALYPYHLQNLAIAVGAMVVGSALIAPITGAVDLVRNPIRRAEFRGGRLALVAACGLAILVAVLAIPVDYHVQAPLVLMPDDAARVYAVVGGTIIDIVPAGSNVKRGQVIGKLRNTESDFEVTRLEGEVKLRQLHVEHLERLRGIDPKANDELPTARSALADSQRRLQERRDEAKRLTLVAPADGVVMPAPRVNSPSPLREGARGEARLPEWSGSLLDPKSLGAHVEPGTLVCLVGDPQRLNAVLLVNDTDIKRIRPGQKVDLCIDELPGQVIGGEVVEVATHEIGNRDTAKPNEADLSPLLTGLIAPGHTEPLYKVRVAFGQGSRVESRELEKDRGSRSEERNGVASENSPPAPGPSRLLIGGRGEAKITAERIRLGQRIFRYLAQTFRLPL
ncbi:MAG TPA: site-2 protease family protein [Lacipirellulaceae bacterium]|nr:site-2 protease family protein [Lacipirellulaceae bacterium]